MKIYTKTGDKGETALYGGTRVSKASARVESYGTIDELNSFIGVAKSEVKDEQVLNQLKKIQFDLFTLGSESATPTDKLTLANGKSRLALMITDTAFYRNKNYHQSTDTIETLDLPSMAKVIDSIYDALMK